MTLSEAAKRPAPWSVGKIRGTLIDAVFDAKGEIVLAALLAKKAERAALELLVKTFNRSRVRK